MTYREEFKKLTKKLIEDYRKRDIKIDTVKIEIDGNISRDDFIVSIRYRLK